MKIITAAIMSVLLSIPTVSFGASHIGKVIKTIHSPDSRACTFFLLNDVNQADPVTPDHGWFSVPLDTTGRHSAILSMLLTSYTTAKPINVVTTGSTACGHAEVSNIHFFVP